MNTFQIIYLAWLAGVFILCKPCRAMWVTLANAVAALSICGALDVSALVRSDATLLLMIADIAAAAALIFTAGFSRVLGLAFAVSAVLHFPAVIFGDSTSATFAIVYLVNVIQMGVLSIGSGGDHGLRRRFRFGDIAARLSSPGRGSRMGQGSVGAISRMVQK